MKIMGKKMVSKLEVCVDSVESAVIAQKAGADCLEVCANLIIGGTTPGVSQFKQIRKACDIKLNVLVRPRAGDFLYTDAEFQMIREDIEMFRELGADGIVCGCLCGDGSLDLGRMKELRECADGLKFTLHRAFDVCRDAKRTLQEAISLQVDTILTSGQACDCMAGKELLKELMVCADGQIEILVGSGVNAEVIRRLKEEIHASSFHMSGKRKIESGMVYRNEHVHMGLPGLSEFELFRTDGEEILRAGMILRGQA
ncbi:copper homeostasis protein CutC [Lachnospiraceae bacterium]|nr:copper homeostasis protein CutC [Lachnospiraceae bacterium]